MQVFIQHNNINSLPRNIRSGDIHGNTNVNLIKRWRVIQTVTGYRENVSETLVVLYNDSLLLWRRTSKHNLIMTQNTIPIIFFQNLHLKTMDNIR